MSFFLYDTAIVNTLKKWTGDNKITVNTYENIFSYRADVAQNREDIVLPIISLSRTGVTLLSTTKKPTSYDGYIGTSQTRAEEEKILLRKLKSVPIKISYQLDVITKNRQENDNFIRELIFKIINNPTIKVDVSYNNSPYTHNFNIRLDEEVADNSDIPSHLDIGESFRQTLVIYVDDAYLFSYTTKDSLILNVETEIKN